MSRVIRELATEEIKMDMTPMIDVTFQLIIFFLFNIRFKVLEGKLAAYLPKDAGVNAAPASPVEHVEITITVDASGEKVNAEDPGAGQPWRGEPERRYEFVGRKLAYQVGPRRLTELDQVEQSLRELHARAPERSSTIDCRAGTVYGDMIPVLDAAIEAGFTEITFVGTYRGTKPR